MFLVHPNYDLETLWDPRYMEFPIWTFTLVVPRLCFWFPYSQRSHEHQGEVQWDLINDLTVKVSSISQLAAFISFCSLLSFSTWTNSLRHLKVFYTLYYFKKEALLSCLVSKLLEREISWYLAIEWYSRSKHNTSPVRIYMETSVRCNKLWFCLTLSLYQSPGDGNHGMFLHQFLRVMFEGFCCCLLLLLFFWFPSLLSVPILLNILSYIFLCSSA